MTRHEKILDKRSMNKKDKIALKQFQEIYEEKVEEEVQMDSKRVKHNPKRIIVFLTAKQISLEFTCAQRQFTAQHT